MSRRDDASLLVLAVVLAAVLALLVPAVVALGDAGEARPTSTPTTVPDPGVRPVLDLPTPVPAPQAPAVPR